MVKNGKIHAFSHVKINIIFISINRWKRLGNSSASVWTIDSESEEIWAIGQQEFSDELATKHLQLQVFLILSKIYEWFCGFLFFLFVVVVIFMISTSISITIIIIDMVVIFLFLPYHWAKWTSENKYIDYNTCEWCRAEQKFPRSFSLHFYYAQFLFSPFFRTKTKQNENNKLNKFRWCFHCVSHSFDFDIGFLMRRTISLWLCCLIVGPTQCTAVHNENICRKYDKFTCGSKQFLCVSFAFDVRFIFYMCVSVSSHVELIILCRHRRHHLCLVKECKCENLLSSESYPMLNFYFLFPFLLLLLIYGTGALNHVPFHQHKISDSSPILRCAHEIA